MPVSNSIRRPQTGGGSVGGAEAVNFRGTIHPTFDCFTLSSDHRATYRPAGSLTGAAPKGRVPSAPAPSSQQHLCTPTGGDGTQSGASSRQYVRLRARHSAPPSSVPVSEDDGVVSGDDREGDVHLATEDELYEGVLSSTAQRHRSKCTGPHQHKQADSNQSSNIPTTSTDSKMLPKSHFGEERGKLDGWRSYLLDVEVALKGLVMDGAEVRPTSDRIVRVMGLFDSFTKGAAPAIRSILKMFRVEFVRALFDPTALLEGRDKRPGDEHADMTSVSVGRLSPYFELMETLRREKAVLSAELDVIEAESSVEDLKRQVIKLQSLVPFYENELERLGRENKQLSDDLKRANVNLDVVSEHHQKAMTALDDEHQRVTRENRELRLNLQRYQQQEDKYGAKATMIAYNHLKSTKTSQLQLLFETGSQEASMLLLLHQLEGLLNNVLTDTDDQYNQCDRAEVTTIRYRLLQRTSLILEEMHEVEKRYLRLTASGSHGKRTLANTLMAVAGPKCTTALARATLPERLSQQQHEEGDAGFISEASRIEANVAAKLHLVDEAMQHSSPLPLNSTANTPTDAVQPNSFGVVTKSLSASSRPSKVVVVVPPPQSSTDPPREGGVVPSPMSDTAKSQALWVRDAFEGLSASKTFQPLANHADPSFVFNKRVSAPLMDVSASKFLGGVEIFASGQLESPHYLQTVNYVDPQHTIELPQKSTHIALKYPNPLRKEVRTKFGHQLLGISDKPGELYGSIVARSQVLEWLKEHAALLQEKSKHSNSNNNNAHADGGGVGGDKEVVDRYGRIANNLDGDRGAPHTSPMKGAHWSVYRRVFGEFRPFLPRLLPVQSIDTLMLNAFVKLNERMSRRYELCLDGAAAKSTSAQTAKMIAERYFREQYHNEDLQLALLEVLEGRYVYPELVVKVLYETLASMETHAISDQSHTQAYLDCLSMGAAGSEAGGGSAAGGSATPAYGHLLALWMHQLSTYWPGTSVSAHVPLDEKEAISLLRALYNVNAGTIKFPLDDMVGDLLFSTCNNVSKALAREYFANGVDSTSEVMVKMFSTSLEAKSVAVQWAELDYDDYLSCLKSLLCDSYASYPLHLYTCCMLNKASRLPPKELAFMAALQVLQGSGRSSYQGL